MKREYFYIETKADWPNDFVQNADIEEQEDLFEFTQANLNTTDPDQRKDCSEISDVLAPYNSTISGENITSTKAKPVIFSDVPVISN